MAQRNLTAEIKVTLTSLTNDPHNIQDWIAQQTVLTVDDWFIENGHLYITVTDVDFDHSKVIKHIASVFRAPVEITMSLHY